jgi:hypothetical protein
MGGKEDKNNRGMAEKTDMLNNLLASGILVCGMQGRKEKAGMDPGNGRSEGGKGGKRDREKQAYSPHATFPPGTGGQDHLRDEP